MGVVFNVADIAENIRTRMNLPTFTTTTNVTQAAVLAAIQESARSIAALTRQKLGTDYDLVTTSTISTQPSLNMVSLPDDFGELYACKWVKSSTELVDVTEATPGLFEPLGFNPRSWDRGANTPRYRLEGHAITFYPCPDQAYTLYLWHSTHFVITSLSNQFMGRLDWDRWIALDVCVTLCNRREKDPSKFLLEKQALEANLFAAKRKRQQASVRTVRDVGIYGDSEPEGWSW